jgi:ATP-binding cassette, subfamily B, bacterial MsbA
MGNEGTQRLHFRTGLWGYVRPHAGRAAAAVLLSLVAAAAASVWAWLLGPLLEAVLSATPRPVFGVTLTREDLAWKLPLAVAGVAAVKAVAQWAHLGLMQQVAQRALAQLRADLFARLSTLPPRWIAERHSGELLARFTSDVAQVEFSVGQALSSWVKDSVTVVALLAVCAAVDLRLFLLAFLVLPATLVPLSRFAKLLKKNATQSQASLGSLTTLAAESLANLPVIQAYNAEGARLEALDAEQRRYLAVMKKSLFVRGAFTPTLEFLGMMGIAAAIVFGVRAVSAEPLLAGKLVSFLAAAVLMYQPLKALSTTWSLVQQGQGAAARLFEVLEVPEAPDGGGTAGPLKTSLALDGVSVRYGETLALDGLSLEVQAGTMVALVGPSGAGKSTVLQLLLGFAGAERGAVRWDGADATTLSRTSLRAQTAWVPQEPLLLSGTVRENLLLAARAASEAELWTALQRAAVDGFVRGLPQGLDTDVGERGGKMSFGQRQRLVVARAFLRQPSLLLLDEPTSALDAESEAALKDGLAALRPGRTVVVVAHRLSTIRAADRIVVLERGKAVESGTHAELAQRGGGCALPLASPNGEAV